MTVAAFRLEEGTLARIRVEVEKRTRGHFVGRESEHRSQLGVALYKATIRVNDVYADGQVVDDAPNCKIQEKAR